MNRKFTLISLSLLIVGCQARPQVDPAGEIARASGLADVVVFHTDEQPLDVGDNVTGVLTISDAVRRAVQNDAGLQAALARVRSALADADQARRLPNPVLNVAVRFPEAGEGKPIIEAGLAADLLAILQQPRRVSAADNRLRAASAETLAAALDLLTEVQQSYASVQALDEQTVVLEQRRKLIQRLLGLAKVRFESGESGRLDVIALDVERVALDVEITQAASERREQRLALARLIGQPSGRTDWKLEPWAPITLVTTDEKEWIAPALAHRPEVQARRWELAALGDEAALASLAAFDGADIGAEAERDPNWSVGPAISTPLPLLDWGGARRARAEAQCIEARHRMTQTRQQVVAEVRRALESLTSSQEALRQVQSELIPLADQRVAHAEASYKNGFADVTAVVLAEQEAQAARTKQIELQQKTSSALYRLHRGVGGPGVAAGVPTTQKGLP